jgi:NAD-dependent DNA ligase
MEEQMNQSTHQPSFEESRRIARKILKAMDGAEMSPAMQRAHETMERLQQAQRDKTGIFSEQFTRLAQMVQASKDGGTPAYGAATRLALAMQANDGSVPVCGMALKYVQPIGEAMKNKTGIFSDEVHKAAERLQAIKDGKLTACGAVGEIAEKFARAMIESNGCMSGSAVSEAARRFVLANEQVDEKLAKAREHLARQADSGSTPASRAAIDAVAESFDRSDRLDKARKHLRNMTNVPRVPPLREQPAPRRVPWQGPSLYRGISMN